MATPGYPQMGQMPPMGGAPMGTPPMGGPGGAAMQRPVRRGTSKAVPIVVSAGLAVGVFCGLLFGVGKKTEASASASASQEEKASQDPSGSGSGSAVAMTSTPTPTPTPEPAGSGAGSATEAATGSGAGSATGAAAGSGAGSAGSAAPTVVEPKTIKLTVTIKPEAAAKSAKLRIDGKELDGTTVELPADTKSVAIEVKASGYRSIDKKIDLAGGDTTIELEMTKRSSSGGVRPPKRPDRPPGGDGGGLIDI